MCGCTTALVVFSVRIMEGVVEGFVVNGNCPIPAKAAATTGAFYFFNHPQSAISDPKYLAPSPNSTANIEPLYPP